MCPFHKFNELDHGPLSSQLHLPRALYARAESNQAEHVELSYVFPYSRLAWRDTARNIYKESETVPDSLFLSLTVSPR